MDLVRKYYPDANETVMGTMNQSRKNVRSTKTTTKPTIKTIEVESTDAPLENNVK